ncbi:hypothetical protein BGZ68_005258 [Mortierella alpina]|nr:hypothetical protein BGZ68_005258 [Mortierella alpina]
MRYTFICLAAAAVVQAIAPYHTSDKAIKDSYIIKFKKPYDVDAFMAKVNSMSTLSKSGDPKPTVEHSYGALSGFAIKATKAAIMALREDDDVESIEQDATITISEVQENPPSWGLIRVSQRKLDLDKPYKYVDAAGKDVTVYVVDTGVDDSHPDLKGRVLQGISFIQHEKDSKDLHGHGTHVAGTIGGTAHGVAKYVSIVPVKVLDRSGSGSLSGVIAGLNWVLEQTRNVAPRFRPVVNMSLGGGKSDALDSAVKTLREADILVVVAAGNEHQDACNVAPARSPFAFTVAASDKTDVFAGYSNFGSCVNIIAPGTGITSTWINGGDPPVERAAPTEQAGTVEHAAVLSQGSHSKARDASVQEDLEVSAEPSNPAPPDNVDPSPNQVRDSRPNFDVLPDTTKIILHFRKGEPLGTLRSVKDWPTPTWEHKREDGYYVLMGRIEHQIKRLKLMKPENAGLVWPAPVPYVQPTNHSTQRSYRPVNQEDYEKVLAHAWYSERRRLGNEESVRIRIYVYLNDGNDERSQHIQRAPVRRMEEAGRIIQEAFRYNQMRKQESHSTERVATNIQAQESDQALVPDTPIFRQAIWLGRRFAASVLQRHHAIRPRR